MELSSDGMMNLMVAVLDRARSDYVYGHGERADGNKQQVREKLEKWLRSDSASLWIGANGPETIINNWRKQGAHQDWRERKKCSSCNRKSCVHYEPGHYTSPHACKGWVSKK